MKNKLKYELSRKVCHKCLKEDEKNGYTCVWLSVENEYCPMLLILEKELSKDEEEKRS